MAALLDDRTSWHKKLTDEAVMEAMQRRIGSLDNPGFCIACGLENGGVEPDARNHECQGCGAKKVFGVMELFEVLS